MNKNILWTELAMFAVAMCVLAIFTDRITVWCLIGYVIGRIIGSLILRK